MYFASAVKVAPLGQLRYDNATSISEEICISQHGAYTAVRRGIRRGGGPGASSSPRLARDMERVRDDFFGSSSLLIESVSDVCRRFDLGLSSSDSGGYPASHDASAFSPLLI